MSFCFWVLFPLREIVNIFLERDRVGAPGSGRSSRFDPKWMSSGGGNAHD